MNSSQSWRRGLHGTTEQLLGLHKSVLKIIAQVLQYSYSLNCERGSHCRLDLASGDPQLLE